MAGKENPGKPRPRITDQQISDMTRLQRQGRSISAIARAIGCNRQTVRVYLKERQGDILADEIKKQLLADEQQKHLDGLTQFAVSLRGHLTIPDSPTEDRDVAMVLDPLLPKDLPQGLDSASREARRKQQQTERQNKVYFESLRQHVGDKGWWQAFEEWRQAWASCVKGQGEVRRQAPEVVGDLFNRQRANLKEEVEEALGGDVLETIVDGVLWVAWRVATASDPEEELKRRKFQVYSRTQQLGVTSYGIISYDNDLRLTFDVTESVLAQEVAEACNLALQDMYPRYMVDEILGLLHRMDEKIEEIDDTLDPFILRPLLVRTRCEWCPV